MRGHRGASLVARVVLAVDAVGLLGALAVVVGLHGRPAPVPVGWPLAALLPLLLAVTVAGELTVVRLRHGDETEGLTLFEAAVVADVLLLPAPAAVLVAVAGLATASALARRQPFKTVFNIGSYGASTAVTVAVVAAFTQVARPTSGFSAPVVAGLAVGTAGFAAVNLVCLAAVLAATGPVGVRQTLREQWRLSAVMAFGGVGLGSIAVALALHTPLLAPFALLPAAALTYAFRAAAQEADERDRSARVIDLSQALAARLDADDLLAGFLTRLRAAFDAERAVVVLTSTAARPGVVVTADEHGVDVLPGTDDDAALLARTGDAAGLVTTALPAGWGPSLLAPLDAEGRRLGAAVLVTRAGRRGGLTARDVAVLSPLLSALGVALQGARHLDRLVEETAKLQAVVDHSSDGIVVVDAGGTVQLWSPAMAAISGVPAHAALSRQLGTVLPAHGPDGGPVDPLRLGWDRLRPAAPRAVVEMELPDVDGRRGDGPRWVRASHAAVFDGDDIARGVLLVHDVTRERQVDRMKADFIATVSHELRTPLTPIKGYTDLLRSRGETLSAQRRRECLDVVADRVAHLTRLVEDLLLASDMSTPSSTVRMTEADLAALVRRTAEDFSGDADRLRVRLPGQPVRVACDPVRVVQVVANLVSNALKYSPAPRPVEVTVTADDDRAWVDVRDQGPGIPADHVERVFDKFHRVQDPRRDATGGTGLGLYIARQLATAMRGSLTVASLPGAGSVFTFSLPRAALEEPAAGTALGPEDRRQPPRFRVPPPPRLREGVALPVVERLSR